MPDHTARAKEAAYSGGFFGIQDASFVWLKRWSSDKIYVQHTLALRGVGFAGIGG
jgi:hypothetical protein